jgi:uncharacterized protein YbbC (DUF1343 family)
VDNLLGTDTVRIAIEAGKPIEPIIEAWAKDSETFRKTRKPFLIYS